MDCLYLYLNKMKINEYWKFPLNLSEYNDERWGKDRHTHTHTHTEGDKAGRVREGREKEWILSFLFGFVRMFTNQKCDAWLNFGCFSVSENSNLLESEVLCYGMWEWYLGFAKSEGLCNIQVYMLNIRSRTGERLDH